MKSEWYERGQSRAAELAATVSGVRNEDWVGKVLTAEARSRKRCGIAAELASLPNDDDGTEGDSPDGSIMRADALYDYERGIEDHLDSLQQEAGQ